MEKILLCWIGRTDLRAMSEPDVGLGPIAQAVRTRGYNIVVLINNYPEAEANAYAKWLKNLTEVEIVLYHENLSGPTHFGEIYEAAVKVVDQTLKDHGDNASITFHLSPGTPAMAAVWIILAKTRFPAGLIESSKEHGVRTASVPFDISAEFIPDLLRKPDRELERLSDGMPPEAPEFTDIIYRSLVMQRIIARARLVALRSVPVLIEGESGTGKELLARAIHMTSPRQGRPFIPVNCGAIPSELIESELFGHEKGAFTGADQAKKGYFEEAQGGTLFLDEIGELSSQAQVKLLRTIQEGEVVRLGSRKTIKIDVRIISATNRTLINEVAQGKFRADLFYRLAVAIIIIPPLRERPGDLSLLIDKLFERVNEESATEPGYHHKKLSPSAKNLLLNHGWPGNVRELLNTLRRLAIWSPASVIGVEDIREALLPDFSVSREGILNLPLGHGLNLLGILSGVARHYLSRALEEARGNKTLAAKLLGLPNYQTFTNWLKKYGIKEDGTPFAH
jgi:DNA-binding NtrC family response regulator